MESKEGMKSGVTVVSEGPSSYPVAPEIVTGIPFGVPVAQTPSPPPGFAPVVAQRSIPSTISTGKRKRGRPRKYDGAGPSTRTISPSPVSFVPPRGSGENLIIQRNVPDQDSGDQFSQCLTGASFLLHTLTVNAGEDVAAKIKSLLQGPRALCVLFGNGVISTVTVKHSTMANSTLTYEGRFQILSLNGACTPREFEGSWGRNGQLNISLASNDGHVVGGVIAGVLIAAEPVKVVVGSFLSGNVKEKKKRNRKDKSKLVVQTTSNPAPATNASTSNPAAPEAGNPPSVSPLQPENGASGAMEEIRPATADTKLSLG